MNVKLISLDGLTKIVNLPEHSTTCIIPIIPKFGFDDGEAVPTCRIIKREYRYEYEHEVNQNGVIIRIFREQHGK